MSEMFDTSPHTAYPAAGNSPLPQRPLSVTELTHKIKRLLETQVRDLVIEGEISGFKGAASGHLYFDLKDSGALIHCVMWATDARRLKFRPENGAKVEIRGRLTVYDQRGQYQVASSSMQPAGLGKLYQAFLEMKERLANEGLFDPAHKKPLPPHPSAIGLVTSPTGAAIQDMLNVLRRRAPHINILIWPARVQGDGSAREIAHAVQRFNQMETSIDVLIVGRGGGSLEDLWAFNEEIVARAIFNSRIPIISAVGHETDTTIADYVADLRAPTPSAAAELVARDSSELLQYLQSLQSRALRAMRDQTSFLRETPHLISRLESAVLPRLTRYRSQLKEFDRSYGIQLPLQRVNESKQHHDNQLERLKRNLSERLRHNKIRFDSYSNQLRNLNPKAILKRGYSITYDSKSGKIIQDESSAPNGTMLNIILGQGQISAITGTGAARKPAARRKSGKLTPVEWFGAESDTDE